MKLKSSLLTLSILLMSVHALDLKASENAAASASTTAAAASASVAASSSVSASSASASSVVSVATPAASASALGSAAEASAPSAANSSASASSVSATVVSSGASSVPASSASGAAAAANGHSEVKRRDEEYRMVTRASVDVEPDLEFSTQSYGQRMGRVSGSAGMVPMIVLSDAPRSRNPRQIEREVIASGVAAVKADEQAAQARRDLHKQKSPAQLEEERKLDTELLKHELKRSEEAAALMREAISRQRDIEEKQEEERWERNKNKRIIRAEQEAAERVAVEAKKYEEAKKRMEDPVGYRIRMATIGAVEKGYQDAIAEEVRDGLKGFITWCGRGIYYAIPANKQRRDEEEEHAAKEAGMMKLRMLLANRSESTLNKSKALGALNSGSFKEELSLLQSEKEEIASCIDTVRRIKANSTDSQTDALIEKLQANREAVLASSVANIERQVNTLMSMQSDDPQENQQKEATLTAIMQGLQLFSQLQSRNQVLTAIKDDSQFGLICNFLTVARSGKTMEIQQTKETFKSTSRQLMQEIAEQNKQQSVYSQHDAMKLHAFLARGKKTENQKDNEEESAPAEAKADLQKKDSQADKDVLKAAGA